MTSPSTPPDAQLLPRYRRLRELQRALHPELADVLPAEALFDAGRRPSLVQGKTFVFEDDHELSVVTDHALYNFRKGGRTLIEERLSRSPVAGDERELLEAMTRARFGAWAVKARAPGVGGHSAQVSWGRWRGACGSQGLIPC